MFPLHDDNPTTLRPFVTVALLLACGWAYVWQIGLGAAAFDRAIYALGLVPAVLTGHARLPPDLDLVAPPWTLLSSMFLHADALHLAGNLLYLWVFGNNVEDATGHRRFVLFYFGCGVFAGLAQVAAAPTSTVPMVGASGAVSGVLGGYLLLHPRASVLVGLPLGFIMHAVRLPALVLLLGWALLQLAGSVLGEAGQPGVAWHAHVAGFVAGGILILFLKRRDVALFAPPRRRAAPPHG
jgi:membrane associated rhomboid family serine protease